MINICKANDLLIITETHFKTRYKSLDGFLCIGRSKPLNMHSKGRGGGIISKKENSPLELGVMLIDFFDCVICSFKETDVILIGMCIPPDNSNYYNSDYFTQLELVLDHYKHSKIILAGDLNSRFGTPTLVHLHNLIIL